MISNRFEHGKSGVFDVVEKAPFEGMEIGADSQHSNDTVVALVVSVWRCASEFKNGAFENREIDEGMRTTCEPNVGIDAVDGVNVAGVSSESGLELGRLDLTKGGSGADGDGAP